MDGRAHYISLDSENGPSFQSLAYLVPRLTKDEQSHLEFTHSSRDNKTR